MFSCSFKADAKNKCTDIIKKADRLNKEANNIKTLFKHLGKF